MGLRHGLLAVVVVVLAAVTGFGCVGPAVGTERIHHYQVDAVIREDRTVRIREVIDYDFGVQTEDKHGIFRFIPIGADISDVEVSSPTAPDRFVESDDGVNHEIKIGDAGSTVSGRHRYVITYTLASVVNGSRFALDAIGDQWPVPVTRADITIRGTELTDPECFTGTYGSTDECAIATSDAEYRVGISDLEDHEAVTVDGDIAATRAAELPALPPFEARDGSARVIWAAIVAGIGLVVALVVFLVSRFVGRNEVAGGGATEAAFGPDGPEAFGRSIPLPEGTPPPVPGARMVADAKMHELAGLEFVPPRGVEPWQAAAVARETIDDRTIGSWFSGLAAHDIITMERDGETVTLAPGPKAAMADATTAPILNRAMAGRDHIVLGTYSSTFALAWAEVGSAVDAWVLASGVFRRRPPRYGSGGGVAVVGTPFAGLAFCLAIPVLLVIGGAGSALFGLQSAFAAVAAAVLVPGIVALAAYSVLTRSLSARGSAIALRTESFRRFLHDSEAQHVEWAWENGLLREYSAWAVALGEADAWNRAMAASSVPPPDVYSSNAILVPALYASSFSSTTTAPSSSGSGGGGFSGGGFSGGGGGGGGGGSW